MEDFLGSLFCFYILWLFCKYATLCNYPCLNRRFHIVVQSELLDRIFLYRPAKTNGWTPHLMGIDGIISYVTLIPSAIYLWIRDGKFLFFNPDGVIISVWFIVTTVEKRYKGHHQRKRQREGFFSKRFSQAQKCSIGLSSGEQDGRKRSLHPAFWAAKSSRFLEWNEALSITITVPCSREGRRWLENQNSKSLLFIVPLY